MYWFDGKKSHQKSTGEREYQQARKKAEEIWNDMQAVNIELAN